MADKTIEQELAELKQANADLVAKLETKEDVIKRQSEQVATLRETAGMASIDDLPAEVKLDYRNRVQCGMPHALALERAVEQHKHNKALIAELPADSQREVAALVKNGADTVSAIAKAKHALHVKNLEAAKAASATATTGKAK